jgi:hypothetical protein
MADLKNILKENLEFYLQREKEIVSILSSLPKGRIREKKISGDRYYYLQYRKEGKVVDEYIGKSVSDELLKSLQKRKALEIELKKIREGINTLKGQRYVIYEFIEPVRNIFYNFTKEKLWDEEIEIIGSWCYILYQRYLTVKKYPLRTEDLDILIPLPYKGKEFDLSKFLKELGFSINFYDDGSLFFTGFGMKIEVLSPEKGRHKEKPVFVEKLKITPQMLRYLDLLLEENIVLNIERGIKVKIPAPAAFFLHKLLVSQKRREKGKREKDLKQAIYTGEYILRNKNETDKLFKLLSKISDSWRKRILRSLEESRKILPDENSLIEKLTVLITR